MRSPLHTAKPTRAAFSLVELLIVFSIISLLVALIMPVLARAKEQMRRTLCLSNNHQVTLATLQLANDNRGWVNGVNGPYDGTPVVGFPLGNTIGPLMGLWPKMIVPYLPGPVDDAGLSQMVQQTGCPNALTTQPLTSSSFGGNANFVGFGYAPMHSLEEVLHTSRIFLVAESSTWKPWSPLHLNFTAFGIVARHNGDGINMSFVDGHGLFVYALQSAPPWSDSSIVATKWYPNNTSYSMMKE